jgi:hypothetical protein
MPSVKLAEICAELLAKRAFAFPYLRAPGVLTLRESLQLPRFIAVFQIATDLVWQRLGQSDDEASGGHRAVENQ